MEQRITFITLGVQDLDVMKNFYRNKFGWTTLREEGIVFFRLNGVILGLFPAEELAADAGIEELHPVAGFRGFTMAINFRSREEVDDRFTELRDKGVRIICPPEEVFWGGYRGYVADPEDNLWELAWNPFLDMDESGNVIDHR